LELLHYPGTDAQTAGKRVKEKLQEWRKSRFMPIAPGRGPAYRRGGAAPVRPPVVASRDDSRDSRPPSPASYRRSHE
jgi:hypothetical protein